MGTPLPQAGPLHCPSRELWLEQTVLLLKKKKNLAPAKRCSLSLPRLHGGSGTQRGQHETQTCTKAQALTHITVIKYPLIFQTGSSVPPFLAWPPSTSSFAPILRIYNLIRSSSNDPPPPQHFGGNRLFAAFARQRIPLGRRRVPHVQEREGAQGPDSLQG